MDCREVQDQLIEFHEEQLGPRDAEQIRAHLGICPRCTEELRGIEKIIGGLKSQRLPDPGEDFWKEFPRRVREAFYEGEGPIRVPILQRVWEGMYGSTKWLPLSKPIGAAVSVAAVVLVIAGLLFFKAGWFRTESTGVGDETLEGYFGGIRAVVQPITSGSLEGLSLYQLDDISGRLMGWLNGMGSSAEVAVNGNGFLGGGDVFAQLEGLSSEELESVYDALRERYFKSTTSFSMPIG